MLAILQDNLLDITLNPRLGIVIVKRARIVGVAGLRAVILVRSLYPHMLPIRRIYRDDDYGRCFSLKENDASAVMEAKHNFRLVRCNIAAMLTCLRDN